MPVAYKWHPIEDLGDDPKSLTDGELVALRRVWTDQKAELIQFGALEEFEQRLRREWSIETGAIENVYTLDRGVTKVLIEKGIVAALIPHGAGKRDPEWIARIIQDHYDALEGMFDFVKGHRELTTGYVKQLHAALLRNEKTYTAVDRSGQVHEIPLDKGRYKTTPNSPTRPDGFEHQYCPPEHVASEMDELVRMHTEHKTRDLPPEVEAAWLHHRFTQIHPFQDGNGRVARAIASLVFIKSGWFPLIVRMAGKAQYLEALETADAGDLRPLVAMFVEMQRNAVIQATEVAYEAKPITSVPEGIAAARDRLIQRGKLSLKEWLAAKDTANKLYQFAAQRFQQITQELRLEIGSAGTGFEFLSDHGLVYSNADVRAIAVLNTGHVANYPEYDMPVQLSFNTGRRAVFALSFHALGPHFRGLVGVVAYFVPHGSDPVLIKDGTFQINYAEDLATAQTRFSAWLERVIVEGLYEWRKTL